MAVFHGDKNLTIRAVGAVSTFNYDLHKWVISAEGKAVAEVRKIATEHGFIEQGKADKPADES